MVEREPQARDAARSATLRRLSAAVLAINARLALREVLQILTDEARAVIGAHQAVTSLTIGESWSQAITATSLSEKYAAFRDDAAPPDGSGIFRLVCRESRTFRLTQAELEAHPGWHGSGLERDRHPPMRGWLATPLTAPDGANLGVLQLSDKIDGEFTEDDEAILVQLAQFASVAIENARNHERLSAAAARGAQLADAAGALAAARSLHEVAAVALRLVGKLDITGVAVYHATMRGELQRIAIHPSVIGDRWPTLPLDAPVPLATAIRTGEPWLGNRAMLLSEFPNLAGTPMPSEALQAVVALPLQVDDRIVGGLAISFAARQAFDEPERSFYRALAWQFAQALDRARLQEDLRRITDTVPALIAHIDGDLRYRFVNASYERWFGLSRGEVIGRTVVEVLGPRAVEVLRPHMEAALAGRVVTFEQRTPYRAGGERMIRGSYTPTRDATGNLDGFIVLVEDISKEKDAEERVALLGEASHVLASSLDYETTLEALARLCVPRLADWCGVDIVREDGTSEQLAVAHADPAKVELARELRRRYPQDPDAPSGVPHVLRTGEPELVEDIPDELLVRLTRDAEHLRIARELGLRSFMAVPIALRGRVLGVLTLVAAESGRRYTAAELALAQGLASRAAQAIENAQLFREAQEATRRKDEFLAMLGHELRNPLAPIVTALQLMRHKGDGRSSREQDVIERQVNHLIRLVDDLLDVSRVTRGKIQLHRAPLELAGVVAKAIEIASPLLEERAHRLVVEVPRDGLAVDGDADRLAQVFANLLTNAAKYTEPAGRIEVRGGATGGRATIEVRDDGIGIAPEMLPHVFELFVQSPQALDRAQGGLGIGLKLARTLVEMHGGTIAAHSDGPGRGSRFVVTLPLSRATVEAAPARDAGRRAVAPGDQRRLLVVDDNEDAAEMLALAIRSAGHLVEVAHDGPSALRLVDRFRPDLALLDIGLPVMDGYELARRLGEKLGPGLRLFAVTGYGMDSDQRRSRAAGFERHFVKPLAVETLLQAVAAAPSGGASASAGAATVPAPPTTDARG